MATITIAKVEDKTTSNGKAFRKVTDTNNNWYSTFEQKMFPLLTQGATVEIEYETTERGFKNILDVIRQLPAPNGHNYVSGGNPDDKRSRAIARQVAIKAAVDFMGGWDPADRTLAVLFDAANQMFNWIVEDEADEPF